MIPPGCTRHGIHTFDPAVYSCPYYSFLACPVVEIEWMSMNSHVYLLSPRQAENLSVSILSDFLITGFLRRAPTQVLQFREEIYEHMQQVLTWSNCPHMYRTVQTSKPFMNNAIMNLFVHNVWTTSPFTSKDCAIDDATSLFLRCPADRKSAAFQEKESKM